MNNSIDPHLQERLNLITCKHYEEQLLINANLKQQNTNYKATLKCCYLPQNFTACHQTPCSSSH